MSNSNDSFNPTIGGHFIHRMFPGKIVKMTGTPHFAWRHLVLNIYGQKKH